jgi:hypothetical protein
MASATYPTALVGQTEGGSTHTSLEKDPRPQPVRASDGPGLVVVQARIGGAEDHLDSRGESGHIEIRPLSPPHAPGPPCR